MKIGVFIFISVLLTVNESRCFVISMFFCMLCVEQDFLLHIYLSVLYILYADSYIWVLFHIYVSHVFCIVYVGVEFLSHTCFSHVSSCSLGK